MSLKSKIILILASVTILWTVVDRLLLNTLVSREFGQLSEEQAEAELALVESWLRREVAHLQDKAEYFASTEATRALVAQADSSPTGPVPEDGALNAVGVHLLYVCSSEGRVRWGSVEDPVSRERISLKRSFPGDSLAPSHPLLKARGDVAELSYLTTERGVMLVASASIADSLGTVIVGRFLDDALLQEIKVETSLSFEILDLYGSDPRGPERVEADKPIPEPGQLFIRANENGDVIASKSLLGVEGRPDIVLHTICGHGVLARGTTVTNFLSLSTLGTSLLIFLVLLRVLQATVLTPLGNLTQFAVRIAETDDTTTRMGVERADEIGILSQEFDRMLDELERSRALFMESARQAGMSEIATGVLHNVGNALNSVNISAIMIGRLTDGLATRDLGLAVDVLEEHADDLPGFVGSHPQGRHTLPMLRGLRKQLDGQKQALDTEAKTLREGVERIVELVRRQQALAGSKGVFEKSSVAEQVEAAVHICQQASASANQVKIHREFETGLPPVLVDKHKLLEILVNLIQNAMQSLEESDTTDKQIDLRVKHVVPNAVRIEVEDNGGGIAPENLLKIFAHGFTTKPDGHGFGLHASANSAQEMDCQMRAESEGLGRGATFTLVIPAAAEETHGRAA